LKEFDLPESQLEKKQLSRPWIPDNLRFWKKKKGWPKKYWLRKR